MKQIRFYITNLLNIFTRQAANDSAFVSEHDQRIERLKAKQKAMFDEMMANGTHMFCRPTYHAGDSHVLREAGLVK